MVGYSLSKASVFSVAVSTAKAEPICILRSVMKKKLSASIFGGGRLSLFADHGVIVPHTENYRAAASICKSDHVLGDTRSKMLLVFDGKTFALFDEHTYSFRFGHHTSQQKTLPRASRIIDDTSITFRIVEMQHTNHATILVSSAMTLVCLLD
jgi:hypothetical protein